MLTFNFKGYSVNVKLYCFKFKEIQRVMFEFQTLFVEFIFWNLIIMLWIS